MTNFIQLNHTASKVHHMEQHANTDFTKTVDKILHEGRVFQLHKIETRMLRIKSVWSHERSLFINACLII